MLRCLATCSTIERIAAYHKYGRRNAGPQDLRALPETFLPSRPILSFYETINNIQANLFFKKVK